ncbi:MAG: RsmD family RNA methyltransferase [Prevotella sp.]|nr:RsmD family RNA methyltransferase [Prevotella sp.]
MRIITGIYKGRHFDIPRSFKARPTTDFAKENIFNVLNGYMDLEGAMALDLFSGTGSISLELVSRGCAHVISVEQDRDHHRFIQDCLKKLGTDVCVPLRGDVFRFIKSCKQQFDFIFADPPYALKELPTIPQLIFEKNLLKPEGVFVFEHGKDNDFSDNPHFVEHRSYGSVNFSIFTTEGKKENKTPKVVDITGKLDDYVTLDEFMRRMKTINIL